MKKFTVTMRVQIPLLIDVEVEAEDADAAVAAASLAEVDEATWGEALHYQHTKRPTDEYCEYANEVLMVEEHE